MRKSIYKVTFIYLVFSVLWIKFSDKILLTFLHRDPRFLTTVQTYKGIFFVLISTLVIYLLLIKDALRVELLDKEKNKFNSLVNSILVNANSYIAVKDLQGKYKMANDAALRFHQKTKSELIGKLTEEIFSPDIAEELLRQDREILKKGLPVEFEGETTDYKGNKIKYHLAKFPLRDDKGEIYSIGVIGRDITAKKNYYERLRIEAEIFKNLKQGIILADREMNIIENNMSISKIFECSDDGLVGKNVEELIFSKIEYENILNLLKSGEQSFEWELFLKKGDKDYFPARFSISSIKNSDDQVEKYTILIEDLTELKNREKKINDLMYSDPLTGLKNKHAFIKCLKEALSYSEKYRGRFAVIYVDINALKSINRSLGHEAGDEVIKAVSKKLLTFVNENICIGKISGDEFAFVVFEKIKIFELKILAQEMLDVFKNPLKIFGKDIYIGLNIGISVYPNDGQNIESLMKNANTALQSSKKNGKKGIEFFSESFNADLDRKFELSCELPKAIDNNEFVIHYQPQLDIKRGKIIGVEALLRWYHPRYGIISPKEFIPIAEETGDIIALGEFVLEKSAAQFKSWLESGYDFERLSVNLSPVQFKEPNIVETLTDILKKVGLQSRYLDIEITESILIEDIIVTENKLKSFKNKGISITLDDFGVGYSSLNYLKSFSLERIKIDREFIKGIPDKDNGSISNIITNLGKNLGLKVLAEGVESDYQNEFMRGLGVDEVQGYYFAKPMGPLELEEFIKIYSNAE